MKYRINFNKVFETFQIVPENPNDIDLILTDPKFICAQNSLVVFKNSIYGKRDSGLHLDFAIDFEMSNIYTMDIIEDDDSSDPESEADDSLRSKLANLKGRVLARSSGTATEENVCVLYTSPDINYSPDFREGIPNDLMLAIDKLNSHLIEIAKNKICSRIGIVKNRESKTYHFTIRFNFHDIKEVNAVNQFLIKQNIIDEDIAARVNTLNSQQEMLTRGKEGFYKKLIIDPIAQWPALFQTVFAAKQVYVPEFLADFTWIESDSYSSRIANIIVAYDQIKGELRKANLFGAAYSGIMGDLKGSANLSNEKRKEILAKYFSDLVFDTHWDKKHAIQPELSASAQAILNFKKK